MTNERVIAGPELVAATVPVMHEDAGADDDADPEDDEVEGPEALLELVLRLVRLPDRLLH